MEQSLSSSLNFDYDAQIKSTSEMLSIIVKTKIQKFQMLPTSLFYLGRTIFMSCSMAKNDNVDISMNGLCMDRICKRTSLNPN